MIYFLFKSLEQSSKIFIYSFKYPKKERGKILKNEAAEPHLEPCRISMMKSFFENTTAKSFTIAV